MPLLHLTVLAIVQGLTEFLPVSSSAHLVLVPHLTGWPDQGLALDVAVHVGTLCAVIVYFRHDVRLMLGGFFGLLAGRPSPGGRLALLVVLATLPVIAAGLLIKPYAGGMLRDVSVIAWATIGFGVLLYIADRFGPLLRRAEQLGRADALLIGVAQVLALIPGTSRSGITMTAARMLGFKRTDAARFSLLLSIPTILAAGTLAGIELYRSGNAGLQLDAALAAGIAFVTALGSIAVMMAWLERAGFAPFVLYRLALGAGLLAWVYG